MSDERIRPEALERLRPRPFVRSVEDVVEAEALWPRFNDPYQAAGKPENHEIPRLIVVMGKDGFKPGATAYHILQYPHIGSGEFGFSADGQWFRIPFYEMRHPKLLSAQGAASCGSATISAFGGCRGFGCRTGISGRAMGRPTTPRSLPASR